MNHSLFYVKENQISPTYSSHYFFIFLFLQFSNIKQFIFLFSETESHTKLKLGLHMNSRLMYHAYLNRAAGVYLFLYFFNFLYLKFQNIKYLVTLFCEAHKVETWYTHGKRVDLLGTSNTSSQKILIPLFFFFFLSLQTCIYKIVLTYFWWLRPGICELCSLSAIFFVLSSFQTLKIFVTLFFENCEAEKV